MANESYLNAAEQVLQAIEGCCDRINATTEADIDSIRNGHVLTLEFSNGTQIVINLQKPLEEIWLATQNGGYHFKWGNGVWRESREGVELFAALTNSASQQSGHPMVFSISG
ncbi:MAG: iron donor protein CyaY [Saezia sp.]